MARPRTINEDALTTRLAGVFSDVGYEGASLALLSQATGLKKASLYHRFPGGKRQMADEVLTAALSWFAENVLEPLNGEGQPSARLKTVTERLDGFYGSGRKACLLNMLASPRAEDGPFTPAIKQAFEGLIEGFAKLARDAGSSPELSRLRANRAVMLIEGSLVLGRGLRSGDPFVAALQGLSGDLLATA